MAAQTNPATDEPDPVFPDPIEDRAFQATWDDLAAWGLVGRRVSEAAYFRLRDLHRARFALLRALAGAEAAGLSVPEAARRTGYPARTIRWWLGQGLLAGHKVGPHWRIPAAALASLPPLTSSHVPAPIPSLPSGERSASDAGRSPAPEPVAGTRGDFTSRRGSTGSGAGDRASRCGSDGIPVPRRRVPRHPSRSKPAPRKGAAVR